MMINSVTHQIDLNKKQYKQLKNAAVKFEAIFMRDIIKKMIPSDPLLKKSTENSIYRSMWIDSLANLMARDGGLGIAKLIVKSFTSGDNLSKLNISGGKRVHWGMKSVKSVKSAYSALPKLTRLLQ